MEQYLFRGIKEGTNSFVYGSLLQSEIDVNKLNVKCFICERFMPDAQIATIPVIPSTVGMWSGLVDKNGVKIFEGDTVHAVARGTISWPCVGKVEYVSQCGYFAINTGKELADDKDSDWYAHFFTHTDFEIIGNIHQNPELLNQSK